MPLLLVLTQLVLAHVNVTMDILVQEQFAMVGCGTVLFNFTITGVCLFWAPDVSRRDLRFWYR